jgi:hypothetical protein
MLAEVPALPLHTAGKYVAAAYIVLFAIVLIYVAIMAIRLSRMERDLGELLELSERSHGGAAGGQRGVQLDPGEAAGRAQGVGESGARAESTPA